MKKILLVLSLILLGEGSLLAQAAPSLSFLTVNDGLSQGMIFDILQSKDGFIWIATKDGLNRYDGARFVTYSPNPFNPFAISSSEIWALHEDQKGRIWILSIDRLDMLEPESGRFFHITSNGERFHGIKIAETPDGGLWFAGEEHISKLEIREEAIEHAIKAGTGIVEGKWKTFRIDENRLPPGKPMGPGPIIFTRDQKLLIGTHTGVEQLDLVSEQFSPIFESPPYYVICMAESPNGAIQVKGNLNMGGQRWVELSGDSTRSFIDQQSAYPRSRFIFDKEGNFWSFRDWKIQKWSPDSFFSGGKPLVEIQGNTLGVNKSQAGTEYMIDKSGLIWVGTSGYGLIKIDENGPKFKTYLPGVSHRILLEDPDGGIYTSWFPDKKFTDKTFEKSVPNEKFKYYQYQTESNVTFAKDGSVWLLENWENRLSRQDVPSETKTYYPFDGLTLLSDKKGNLVSVNEEGLHRFNIKTKSADHFPFAAPIPKLSEVSKYLYEDSEGTLWIFGLTGLIKAVPTSIGYDYTQYKNDTKNPTSLCFNTVTCAVDDPIEPERYLWLGTKGGGLSRLDKKDETFKQYTRDHGLPDNVVYGLLAEDHHGTRHAPGYIWLSTNKGLCRFDVREEKTQNFTAEDGLQNNEFNSASYLKTKDGTLIFGGINGLNVFHPDSLHFNENLPTIHIVGLSVDNIPVSTVGFGKNAIEGGSRLQFAHDQNLFNFEFAALEFTNPSQNQYKYQLLGFDQQWVDLGTKNSIQFANLAPGTYTFRVDGSNNDGIWSGQPAEVQFTILPPWWASWWAYLLYFGLGTTAIWLLYTYRLNQKVQMQETLRLREMDEFKSRFFTNITHEFRTPLTVILGMSEQISKEEPNEKKKAKLGLIKRNGESLLRLINQILDLAKLETKTIDLHYVQGDILAYLKYIAESLHSLANAQNVMLRVESDESSIVMDYDPERFLQIIHNLLSNAIKFTTSGGKVLLRTELRGKWLYIAVADSGVGIPKEELPHLFERFFQAKNQEHAKSGGTGIGLSLTAELVKALGGNIAVESEVGVGSTFILNLPVTNNALFLPFEKTGYFEKENGLPKSSELDPTSDMQMDDSALPQILLIEDNPDVVEYLTACLTAGSIDEKTPPYRLNYAYNGEAGIEKALETIPDLIISDVMMPIKDGFEVLEALKNDERTSHIPIILLTAKADIKSRLAGLRHGADFYLSKPFHQEELLVTIENLMIIRKKLHEKYSKVNLEASSSLSDAFDTLPDPEDIFLQKFRTIVEQRMSDTAFEMVHLEKALGMSRSQIYRKVKALTGKSPSLFIRSIRLHQGRHLLLTTDLTISEIAYSVGYSGLNNFSDAFLEEFGERPLMTRGKN